MVGGGGDCGGRCLHSNRCLRVKATYSIRRRDSDCGGGSGGSGGGTMAHSLWEMSRKTSPQLISLIFFRVIFLLYLPIHIFVLPILATFSL